MAPRLGKHDRFGILLTSDRDRRFDAATIADLLRQCGIPVFEADDEIGAALAGPGDHRASRLIVEWIAQYRLTALLLCSGPESDEGIGHFRRLVGILNDEKLLDARDGALHSLFFGGSPAGCVAAKERFPFVAGTLSHDDGPLACLARLGIPGSLLPSAVKGELDYDENRLAFGKDLVERADYRGVEAVDRSGSMRFGVRGDSLAARIAQGSLRGFAPLVSVRVGAWDPSKPESLDALVDLSARLARGGLLDVLSIGAAQGPGDQVSDRPEDYERIWEAARPLLLRSHPGTREIAERVRMLEERIDPAWQSLSFWWYSRLDGRGPNSVLENLREHFGALDYLASTGKPLEADLPRHLAACGADDVSLVVAGYIAAKAAKRAGVQKLVLELLVGARGRGAKDLARVRALLHLVRELEEGDFRVYVQPRIADDGKPQEGESSLARLAAAAVLMDDIEAWDTNSPEIVDLAGHFGTVNFDADTIEDSIRLIRRSFVEYRRMKDEGLVADMATNPVVLLRTSEILSEARATIAAIESSLRSPYSPEGFHEILRLGFLALPRLGGSREEFPGALKWRTRLENGAVVIVDASGRVLTARARLPAIVDAADRA